MSRADRKGRSTNGGKFVQLHDWMMKTPAWRSLPPQARAVYIELLRLYDGKNNGLLALGVRAAADRANVNKDTASRCFDMLEERGFIECAQRGGFNVNARLATEWRLTHHRCDRSHQAPSKAFTRWSPNLDPRPKRGTGKSEREGREEPGEAVSVPPLRTVA